MQTIEIRFYLREEVSLSVYLQINYILYGMLGVNWGKILSLYWSSHNRLCKVYFGRNLSNEEVQSNPSISTLKLQNKKKYPRSMKVMKLWKCSILKDNPSSEGMRWAKNSSFLPATKLGQGNIFRSVCQEFCSQGGGGGGIPACIAGLQAHTQGGSWGVWPGGDRQAHTQGGSWRVWPGGITRPTPRGEVSRSTLGEGGVSRPTPRGRFPRHIPGGIIPACTEADIPPADGYCCGRYASYWNAFLFACHFSL